MLPVGIALFREGFHPLGPGLAQVPGPGLSISQEPCLLREGKEGTWSRAQLPTLTLQGPGSSPCPVVILLSHQRGILSPGLFNSSIMFPRLEPLVPYCPEQYFAFV